MRTNAFQNLLAGLLLGIALPGMSEPRVQPFADAVAPVLQERCLPCHGAEQSKGGLRLHTEADAQAGGVITPGNPDTSELLRRITSTQPSDRMPPKGAPLSETQVAAIRTWIASGAAWDDEAMARPIRRGESHWAFHSPVQPPLPLVQHGAWARNPIDHFLLARLESAGLAPSPEADRPTLARRLYLDLIGLPPTPAEVDAFVLDHRPDAYERLMETLLQSPHFGEKQAIRWLDIAHYADTNGYEKDRHRNIWPYRDWVIQAFNADMPYDQFVIEQLAGDLLPGATQEQRTATGFLRNSLYNEEGGVDVEEFRFEAMVDRVNTTATAFMGLTLSCAQCHDHKYDPISQREYYSFFGFLNNTDNVELPLRTPALDAERAEQTAAIAAAIENLESEFPTGAGTPGFAESYAAWRAEMQLKARDWQVLSPVALASAKTATLERLPDDSVLVSGEFPNVDTYTIGFRCDDREVRALRLEALPHPTLSGGGPGRGVIMSPDGDFFLSEVRAFVAPWKNPEQRQPVAPASASADFEAEGRAVGLTLDGQVDTGWGINGQQGRPHAAVYTLAAPLPEFEGGALLTLELEHFYVHLHTLGRFRVSTAGGGDSFVATGLEADTEAAILAGEDNPATRRAFLLEAPEVTEARERIARMEKRLPAYPTTLALQERATPRQTSVHHRGLFSSPADPVEPGTPEAMHPFPPNWPRNRMSFAQWLVAQDNPLFARVLVNRVWQSIFGRGLVETTEDFGLMGSPPSHPELLDWLAVEFQRRGYSTKELLRLIVTSSAYRQQSTAVPEAVEKDPMNVLLARAPRLRLDAELVRDAALASSGLLVAEVGGPSVYPPIQPEVFASAYGGSESMWPESRGANRYRRGLYTYLKRAAVYPTASTFDMPSRDTVCTRRSESNTPLQALTLLNNSEFFVAARAMAARVLKEASPDPKAQLEYAVKLALGRAPDAVESAELLAFLESQRTRFASGAASPEPLTEGFALENAAPDVQAAWTALCRVLLNLDEAISKS